MRVPFLFFYNKPVINEKSNRVICEQRVKELDPITPIFCATGHYADMVKPLLGGVLAREAG